MTPLWQLSAVEQAAGVKNRTFTATELVHSALGRIEQKNAQLNAIVDLLDESALTAAQAADAAVADGKTLGPLHGVPVTVKVNVDTKGRATTQVHPSSVSRTEVGLLDNRIEFFESNDANITQHQQSPD